MIQSTNGFVKCRTAVNSLILHLTGIYSDQCNVIKSSSRANLDQSCCVYALITASQNCVRLQVLQGILN